MGAGLCRAGEGAPPRRYRARHPVSLYWPGEDGEVHSQLCTTDCLFTLVEGEPQPGQAWWRLTAHLPGAGQAEEADVNHL